ncbi:MAG TPA: NAD-dependent epimerase/dehydratase family protein [Phycisphaerales bacterium]|nr:NAD-dependent epimerase/dehydratase family protein [Phycisphaerales bacterium]
MSGTVLVTGGAGFLGRYVVKRLVESGGFAHVKVVDLNVGPGPFEEGSWAGVETVGGIDVCDYDRLRSEFDRVDCVVHLAGVVSFSLKNKELLWRVNVDGTKNVLRAAAECGAKRFVHVSSVAALGFADDEDVLVDEEFEFDFSIASRYRKYYMLSKRHADVEVERRFGEGLGGVVLYPGLMFGPGDRVNSARWIAAIKAGKMPFNMPGGTNVVDVRDVARAVATAAADENIAGRVLLSGANMRLKAMNEVIAEAVGAGGPKVTLPRCLREAMFRLVLGAEMIAKGKLAVTADNVDSAFRVRYFSNAKAKRVLGWEPEIGFEQTVRDTIEWMNAEW